MDVGRVLIFSGLMLSVPTSASNVLDGQHICSLGTNRSCYKIGYFDDSRHRLKFEDAQRTCRNDGGDLLSIESSAEQSLVEGFIQGLKASDGDFWMGLRRHPNYEENIDCNSQYYWVDGSQSNFRNWHIDEPSCGYEVCVVMYHQPSASLDEGNQYMFQWNDDNCETKNNFICKYTKVDTLDTEPKQDVKTDVFKTTTLTTEVARDPSVTVHDGGISGVVSNHPDVIKTTLTTEVARKPSVTAHDDGISVVVTEHPGSLMNIVYIVLPMIPLLMLLIVAHGVFCFKLFSKRRRTQTKTPTEKHGTWPPAERCSSPSPDVYNVIRRQHEADLTDSRPRPKNTSFLGSSPDTPTDEYDNLGGHDTESGFVTLASTESGFVTSDLYESYQNRSSTSCHREHSWLDNELYSY